MASALQFVEDGHLYLMDGRPVPSVTTVLEDVGIIDYSWLPEGTRTMALERGRFVHQICQFHDEGDLGEFDLSLEGYLEAWKRFRREFGFTPTLIEHREYCKTYGYAGTLDRCAKITMYPSRDVILDIKTNCAPHWTAYQTAAYANFFESPGKYRRLAVALHDDGSYKIHEYHCKDFSRDLGIFLSALTVYNAKRKR
jgi:hypothetical protein